MSSWITFALVVLVLFGAPSVRASDSSHSRWLYVAPFAAWAIAVLGLTLAVLVDAKGWPKMPLFDSGKHKRDSHGKWASGGGGALPKVKLGTREHHDAQASKHAGKALGFARAQIASPKGSAQAAAMHQAAISHAGHAVAHAQKVGHTGKAEEQASRALDVIKAAHESVGHPSDDYFATRDKVFGHPVSPGDGEHAMRGKHEVADKFHDKAPNPSEFKSSPDAKGSALKKKADAASWTAHGSTGDNDHDSTENHVRAADAHQAAADHFAHQGDRAQAMHHEAQAKIHSDQAAAEAKADRAKRKASILDPKIRATASNTADRAERASRDAENAGYSKDHGHAARKHQQAADQHRSAADAHRATGDRKTSKYHEQRAVEHDKEQAKHFAKIGNSISSKRLLGALSAISGGRPAGSKTK